MILHNLGYVVCFPLPGTASRYGALNHIVLWLLIISGFTYIGKRWYLSVWFGVGLLIIATTNTVYWRSVYQANLEHMQFVRKKAAFYVQEHFSLDENCAAYDLGAIRYYSQRPIVDMAGLVDPNATLRLLVGEMDAYLVENGVACLVWPGRFNSKVKGWGLDLAEIMGIKNTSLFLSEELAVFKIAHHRWLHGYLPTGNYHAEVTVYRLQTSVPLNE
jgi:hypothetical protein